MIMAEVGPVTLNALDEELVFENMYLDDCDILLVQVYTNEASTLTWTFYQSVDGTNWVPFSVTPATGSFGSGFSLSGTTGSNLFRCSLQNIPYAKVRITAFTSGSITVTKAVSAKYFR